MVHMRQLVSGAGFVCVPRPRAFVASRSPDVQTHPEPASPRSCWFLGSLWSWSLFLVSAREECAAVPPQPPRLRHSVTRVQITLDNSILTLSAISSVYLFSIIAVFFVDFSGINVSLGCKGFLFFFSCRWPHRWIIAEYHKKKAIFVLSHLHVFFSK